MTARAASTGSASVRVAIGAALTVIGAAGLACASGQRDEPRAPARTAPASVRTSARGEVARRRDDAGRVVRVALAVDAREATVSGDGEWRVYDEERGAAIARAPGGSAWTIERSGALLRVVGAGMATSWRPGPLIIRTAGYGALLSHGGHHYRGELWVHAASGGGVTVVNRLPIEEYLRGVVPLELPSGSPGDIAAVQAQAVAARSYTYSRLAEYLPRYDAVRRAGQPFDVRATVADQVYGGADAERAASDRAIIATAGLVLRWQGAVVSAPYHSACGGSTAEPQEVWRSEAEPYLRRVSDRVPGTDHYYCEIAPRFHWVREWDGAALDGALTRYLRGVSNVGAVRAVRVATRTPSGRVGTLAVEGEQGSTVLRGNDIRFAFRAAGGEILASTYFSVDAAVAEDGRVAHLTLRGNGNGHGIGMCQWGAIGRARAGQDYRTILRTYYPGTTIEPAE